MFHVGGPITLDARIRGGSARATRAGERMRARGTGRSVRFGKLDGRGARGDIQLGVEAAAVALDCADRDLQPVGHLFTRQAVGKEAQHLPFARSQLYQWLYRLRFDPRDLIKDSEDSHLRIAQQAHLNSSRYYGFEPIPFVANASQSVRLNCFAQHGGGCTHGLVPSVPRVEPGYA